MVTRTMVFGKDNWPTDYPDNNMGADKVTGTAAANFIDGGAGNDTINAAAGDDVVLPGRGADNVTLGDGVDTVVYTSVLDSPASAPDLIVDFKSGVDLLDLKQVDANVLVAGDQDFNLIFGNPFSNTAAELRIDANTGRVEGDVDGNGTADLVIQFGSELPTGGGQIAFLVIGGGEPPPPAGDIVF
jgi:serralysin